MVTNTAYLFMFMSETSSGCNTSALSEVKSGRFLWKMNIFKGTRS